MVYAYVNLIVTNPDSMVAYRSKAGAALTKHGGKVLNASPSQTIIEGTRDATGLGVILEFATEAAAHAWINDPDLQETHALRRGAGTSTITLLA